MSVLLFDPIDVRMNIAKLTPMSAKVNTRRYDASRRRAAAAATRSQILRSARELFIARGYAATTMAAIADHAGVSPDTLYAVIGTKSVLFRELVETALSGTDDVIPGEQRDYVQQMRASAGIHQKLAMYAHAVTLIQQRLAPLFL